MPNDVITINPQAHIEVASHYPSANVAAVVTIAADADKFHAISRIDYSYDAAPTGGNLQVVAGSTTILNVDITSAGHGYFDLKFPDLLHNAFTKNEAVVVTLAAGGSGVDGKLTVRYC